ncbi:ketoacyl-ACP synthase III, partial [Escherichia coli]|nr:ketoacyl-ACP synthase III [Escherichia coli]
MPNTVIIGSGSCVPSNIIKGSDFLDSIFFDDNKELIDKPVQEVIDKFVEITE